MGTQGYNSKLLQTSSSSITLKNLDLISQNHFKYFLKDFLPKLVRCKLLFNCHSQNMKLADLKLLFNGGRNSHFSLARLLLRLHYRITRYTAHFFTYSFRKPSSIDQSSENYRDPRKVNRVLEQNWRKALSNSQSQLKILIFVILCNTNWTTPFEICETLMVFCVDFQKLKRKRRKTNPMWEWTSVQMYQICSPLRN